ncbi:hypothetical protein L3Q82_007889 [Scortum barcoo]|uniref:Uncharacterized protein n=1 Tax=Scortum barcoo TaxID=214431 RepID=A0ACB8WKC6_9TELE|nr:hypothetical protein L3Q82_007889 [Scortum barcoo]
MRFINGTRLDDRIIRTDWDAGFKEGRQYGRGKSGGQVRDEYRQDYDPARGGYGEVVSTITAVTFFTPMAMNNWRLVTGILDPLAEEEVGQTWQTQTYCEGLLGTSGRALCQGGLQLPPPEELLTDSEFEVVDARSLVPVRGGNPFKPGGGHRKYRQAKQAAAQTVLEAKTRVWEEFGEAMEEDYRSASKRFWQTVRRLRRGKQYSANTVYSAGGELLT